MIEFISTHLVAAYIVTAIAFAMIELRLEGSVGGPDEAFWLTLMVAVIFPLALIRRTYIVISTVILWIVTPSNRKQRNAAAEEVTSILKKIKKATSKSA
jgi:hypothetical protein